MTTLRDVMDALAAPDRDALGPATLYGDLATVYEFERERMRDHEAIADFVAAEAPSEATSVAVGACGPGFVLAGLDARFEEAVGIDLSPRMLELAAGRTDAHLVAADLATFVAPGRFDVVTLLGGTIAHLPVEHPGAGRDASDGGTRSEGRRSDDDGSDDPRDAVPAVLANAHESLAPGGVFVCDFMERGALRSGHVSETAFESDRFRLERTVLTTGEDRGPDPLGATGRYTFAYEIADERAGDAVRVGTSTPVREFDVPKLLGAALSAGFDDVALASPPTHGRGLVAKRGE